MPDLGRWFGMDQLSEKYHSTSPYAYVMNNPAMMFDPDGRVSMDWINSFWNNSQNGVNTTWTNTGSGFSNNWGGNMDYDASPTNFSFGGTSTGIGSSYSGNYAGTINLPPVYLTGKSSGWGQQIQSQFNSYMNGWNAQGGFGNILSNTSFLANTAIGLGSTANIPRSGFLKYNELWHQTKTRGISTAFEGKWSNPGAKFWRGQQIKPFEGARNLGTKLTIAGGALLVADVAMSGKVKPSHIINGAMLGASTTGVGSIVAGVWFVADMGTGAVNYLGGNGFTTLSDVIDQSEWGQSITLDMYDGLY